MNIKIAATGAAATAMVVTGLLASPANAGTHTVNWTEQTCHALEAWQRQPGDDRLERLVLDAAQLPKSYLKADVFELASDAASPGKNAAQYLSVAVQYASEDCFGGA